MYHILIINLVLKNRGHVNTFVMKNEDGVSRLAPSNTAAINFALAQTAARMIAETGKSEVARLLAEWEASQQEAEGSAQRRY